MGKKLREEPAFDPDQPFVSVTSEDETSPAFDHTQAFEPVKKKDETTVSEQPGSEDGGSVSPEPAKPSEKPTPKEKYDSRVNDLLGLYQQKFLDQLQPTINTEQERYEQQVAGKQKELQTLVDSKQLSSDKANEQLSAFSSTIADEVNTRVRDLQKSASEQFDKEQSPEIKSWLDRYQQDFLKEQTAFDKANFNKTKERNPAVTLGKTLWSTMRYQLPADLIGGSMALEQLPFDLNRNIFAPVFDKIFGESKVKNAQLAPQVAERRNMLLKQALEMRGKGQEYTKDLVNTLDKAEDFVDYMNWTGAAVGQAAGQIPAALLTRGGTAYGQEIGTIYLDGVKKIAEENQMTPEQVMEKGMDDALYPVLMGYGAGKLEMIGAEGVAGSFSKKEVMSSLRDRALGFFKSTGKSASKEAITEAGQSILEQLGVSKAAGKTWAETFTSIDPNDIKESAAQGFVGGGGLSMAGQGLQSIANKYTVKAPDDIASKTPQQVIQEQKATIQSSSDVTKAAAVAEAIQDKVNQSTEGIQDDSTIGEREISGQERVGQEPVQAGTEPRRSGEETSASGIFQKEEEKVEPAPAPKTRGELASKQQNIPADLKERGVTISGNLDLLSRFDSGERIFAFPEQDNEPIELTDVGQFAGYSHDQLLAYPEQEGKQKVFVYGTLQDEKTRKKALGEDVTATETTMPGFTKQEGDFSTIQKGQGEVKGQMLELTTEQVEKLDKWESKYDRKEIQPGVFAYVRKPNVTEKGKEVSNEAIRVAKEYDEEARNPTVNPKDVAIASVIGKVQLGKYGDKNAVTNNIAKSYLSKTGIPIDIVAQKASSEGMEITPDDVWDFMQRYPAGPTTMTTPAGNPKLRQLSQKYTELTGKSLNRRTARDIATSLTESLGDEQANAEVAKLMTPEGELDAAKTLAQLKADPEKFQKDHGLNDEDFERLKYDLNEELNQQVLRGDRQTDQPAEGQGTGEPVQGGPLSEQFGDQTQDSEKVVEEITSRPLTHVTGLNMGKGLSAGTYLSSEQQNRYGNEPRKATVNISKPFVFKSENGIIPFRNKVLNDNLKSFDPEDYEDGNIFRREATLDDLSEKGVVKLANLVRQRLQQEGYDSIYLPETETQEGEVIVFDRNNVTIEPPPTPPQSLETQPFEPEQGTRETVKKLQEDSNLHDNLKDAIEDFKNYAIKRQDRSQKQARRTIENLGPDEALRQATSFKWGRSIEEKMAVLSELASDFSNQFRQAAANGDQKTEQEAYDKFMMAMDSLSNHITDTAQALAYLNLTGRMFETKTGAVRHATRQINASREGALRNYEDTKLTIEKVLEEFDKLSKEDFLKSKRVQDLMAEIKKSRSVQSRVAHKNLNDAASRLKQAWQNAQKTGIIWDPKSKAKEHLEIHKALVNYITALIKTIVADTGETIKNIGAEVSTQFKAFLKDNKIEINDADADSLVKDELDKQVNKNLEKKYKKDLKEAFQAYANGEIKTIDELIDNIVQTEQLDQEQAASFAKRFNDLFSEYATKEKQRLVKKYTPKGKVSETNKRKRTEFYEKVIQLSNVGAVSDMQLTDELAKIFGIPAMTPEIVKNIESMVDDIAKAPDGRFKNIAITKLNDYITQQQQFNITNYLMSSYKAGIFSGIDTQALNLQGNMFNVLEMGFMLGFTNPMVAARFFRAIARPENMSRSINEALKMLQTGYDPRSTGDSRRVLEQFSRSFFGSAKGIKGWKQVLDPSLEQQKKYVFRALSAGDLLFTTAINDALQNELMYREGKRQGLKGEELDRYVREQMGYIPENITRQAERAKKEAANGSIPHDKASITLRTYELIEQQRNPEMIAQARQFASEQIMTNSPRGFIGTFARNVNNLIHEIPVLSAFIPVVNFAANAMSRAIQYMPHTALMREVAHGISNRTKGVYFSTQWKEMVQRIQSGDLDTEMRIRRALIGTTTMAILVALLSDDDKDENLLSKMLGKTIKIHGRGPGTQFNRQETYQLQESGWLPFSIQVGDKYIPYKNYPALNVLLATMGEWNDAVRYKKLERQDAWERMTFALGNSFKVISEMGFLSSLNTLLSAALEGEVKSLTDVPTRIATGALVPKFQRNLVNLFDNKVYSGGSMKELITRSMPVVNTFANEPLVNALGEPVEKNWWDRVELWNTDAYSKYQPLWQANADKKYFFPVPNRYSIEKKMGRPISTKEYNEYFRIRGQQIVKSWNPDFTKLSPEKYEEKMDRLTRYADYKALVQMGAMKSDVMKDINFYLDDVNEVQRETQKLRKEIFK